MPESIATSLALLDFCPETDTFLDDVVAGLSRRQKTLPYKYFYDEAGSALFDQICRLDAYYPTRTEISIMENCAGEMAAEMGEHVVLVEYGSGSSIKTRILLDHLRNPAAYVPIDISKEHLLRSARAIAHEYPGLSVLPVCADYTTAFHLPTIADADARTVVYFPGSTIGNFDAAEANAFLRRIARIVGAGGGLLIGVDLKKDRTLLERAYDDEEGITAAFNKNLLVRINDELGGTFDLDRFAHRAVYNEKLGRVEMYLVSLAKQQVRIGEHVFDFAEGEAIHTENSHKYDLDGFDELAHRAGFDVRHVWVDDAGLFSVQYLVAH